MSRLLYNYHTHTARCNHARGTDEEYVRAAIAGGYRVLGMSDHAPWPFAGGYVSRIRMRCEELPDYIASFSRLKEKYEGQIVLHTGLECEYFPRYSDHIRRMLDSGISYLILGQHYADSEEDNPPAARVSETGEDGILRYADSVVQAIGTGLYTYVAHPDLYMKFLKNEDFSKTCERAADMICQAAAEADMPVEFNLLGQLEEVGYPSAAFWQYARKWNNRVILGVDAHAPDHLTNTANIDKGFDIVTGLGYQVQDRLPMDD